MWALRILTGPQSGQMIELKLGRNVIGRAPQCDIKLISPGVSKEHTEITVFKEKIVIGDLKSSNGTYLNGIRVQNSLMRLGDKLGVHDVLLDVIPAPEMRVGPLRTSAPAPAMGMPQQHQMPGMDMGQMAPSPSAAEAPAPAYQQGGFKGLVDKLNEYIERVALPGVYKIPQYLEFKIVIMCFVGLFIFSTTLLSMIPMLAITKASVIQESKRRAGSIARTVATINQGALLQNSYASLSTNAAESEEGVTQVLIVQASDGMILAPATRAGTTPDLPFVHSARLEGRPIQVEVNSSTIGASFPIGLFDPNTGEQTIKAHAVVLYDIGSLAFDDGRAISLFMQTLVISSLIGFFIYFFMYKLIEYPIVRLNAQLDIAMREKKDTTEVDFIFPPFQALVGNINSLLTRYIHGESEGGSHPNGFVNKDGEAENLVQVVGFPCIAISREGRIISCNAGFYQIARTEQGTLQGQLFNAIPDASLQKNIESLLLRARDSVHTIQTDQLEFSGHLCVLSCQAFCADGKDPDYFLITVSPTEGET